MPVGCSEAGTCGTGSLDRVISAVHPVTAREPYRFIGHEPERWGYVEVASRSGPAAAYEEPSPLRGGPTRADRLARPRLWLRTLTEARPGTHRLLVADTAQLQRVRSGAWVSRELARGAKVYYMGWLADGQRPHQHWIIGVQGAREAFASGQLEFLDFPTVIDRSGASTAGLLRLQTDEVERALDEGWQRLAISQESSRRPMVDEAQATEFAAQERGYDLLAERWSLHTLCQLTIEEKNDAAIWESTGVHYRNIVDGNWTSTTLGGRWQPRGELDAHVARRFGAALYSALGDARQSADGPDLHIDFSAVDFMDVACGQVLMLAARSAARHQRVIIHNASTFVRHLVDMVGRPRTLLFDHEAGPP